jgi:DNA-binding XRE family transcriptional regulator
VIAIEKEKYDPSLPLAFKISYLFGKPIEDIFHCPKQTDEKHSPKEISQ